MDKVRLDKWLWAARFFKTRTLAKTAIDRGKISVDGQRAKPSREITINTQLNIRNGWDEKTVSVTTLSDQRRGATEAATLYTETSESIATREQNAAQRRAARNAYGPPPQRPNKKQRRQIHRFKQDNG